VVEAADKNVGWIFGWEHHGTEVGDERNLRIQEDAGKLYDMLEKITALYYDTNRKGILNESSDWLTKMIHSIAAAGFFNTDRMVEEYEKKIWGLAR
jgi:glucan phosphorylase